MIEPLPLPDDDAGGVPAINGDAKPLPYLRGESGWGALFFLRVWVRVAILALELEVKKYSLYYHKYRSEHNSFHLVECRLKQDSANRREYPRSVSC